jgi:hypothetical protein
MKTILVLAGLLMLVAGCRQEDNFPQPFDENGAPIPNPAGDAGGLPSGVGHSWPDYISDEIPILEGHISMVMEAPGSHIRLFYEGLTESQIEDYLDELEKSGFQLEFLLYVQEGFPDNSEERSRRGEFDAVDITRGDYHMRLEVGGELATYDIYTSGFEQQAVEAQAPQWPSELEGVIPPPDRCVLSRVMTFQAGSYYITCAMEDEPVLDEYRMALEALGFQEDSNIVTAPGVTSVHLLREAIQIQLGISLTSELEIQITTN